MLGVRRTAREIAPENAPNIRCTAREIAPENAPNIRCTARETAPEIAPNIMLRGATLVCTCLTILSLPFGGNFQRKIWHGHGFNNQMNTY